MVLLLPRIYTGWREFPCKTFESIHGDGLHSSVIFNNIKMIYWFELLPFILIKLKRMNVGHSPEKVVESGKCKKQKIMYTFLLSLSLVLYLSLSFSLFLSLSISLSLSLSVDVCTAATWAAFIKNLNSASC